jgi:hypothetical protein
MRLGANVERSTCCGRRRNDAAGQLVLGEPLKLLTGNEHGAHTLLVKAVDLPVAVEWRRRVVAADTLLPMLPAALGVKATGDTAVVDDVQFVSDKRGV